jgi:hypothetical protein
MAKKFLIFCHLLSLRTRQIASIHLIPGCHMQPMPFLYKSLSVLRTRFRYFAFGLNQQAPESNISPDLLTCGTRCFFLAHHSFAEKILAVSFEGSMNSL